MERLLKGLTGTKIDVNCGSSMIYRGEIVSAEDGLLRLKHEDGHEIFVSVEKIAAVAECKDLSSRPGFIG